MALAHTKVKLEIREISLKNRPQDLYNISPKGTVPALQLLNQTVIDESLDIMLWCLKEYNSPWVSIQLDKQLNIISVNDEKFKYWLDRYKYFDRYPDQSQIVYQKKCDFYLNVYEEKLNNSTYLIDDNMRLVDIAIFPFIRQYANINKEHFTLKFVNLNKWLKKNLKSKLFISVMHN